MTEGEFVQTPSAHTDADLEADYEPVDGSFDSTPSAHVVAVLSATEPGN